ncbi:hypothetical protein DL762_006785 [Monosporascus cannonballus]|uniref:Glycosyltransferase family 31 protein n=1 Tax=Monosporascus cannonballus TaxID=155416 RepID=A0ABY0H450_9PEZI|nr:hypothetical protein DL762_006785 [Monosporascus cannonballus]
MFSRIPRVFVSASIALLFFVFCTTLYLYHNAPVYHATGNSPVPTSKIEEHWDQPSQDGVFQDVKGDGASAATDIDPAASPTVSASTSSDGSDKPPATGQEHVKKPEQGVEPDKDLGHNPGQSTASRPSGMGCLADVQFLTRAATEQNLTERVRYTRSCIKPVFSAKVDRDEVVNISEPIFKGATELDLLDCWDIQLPECSPVKLTVPNPYPKGDYAHLIFGVATSYERLNDSIPAFAHWLSGTRSKLIASVTDIQEKNRTEMGYLQDKFQASGIDSVMVKPLDPEFKTSQNHFGVLKDMVEYSGPETQWFALLDDDTFFPNLKPLSDALAKLDHTKDAYVGTLSEDFSSIRNWGYMAFGGAGAYLSAPLAVKLAEKVFECIKESSLSEGDVITRECVYTKSKAKLTIMPGLYQQDIQGDASGFFEAGLRPINLHHWKSWFKAPVTAMAKAADFCGDCFLQRWRLGNDTVLSNGYSVARYRDGLDAVDLTTLEGTFDKLDGDFDFSIGPFRKPYPKKRKKSYKLLDAEITQRGDLRQLYVWKGNETLGELDEVVEMIWQK